MEKYFCHVCKREHEGKPAYQIVENYIFKALEDKKDMTTRQYKTLYHKASFAVCNSAINILLFPSDAVQAEIKEIRE